MPEFIYEMHILHWTYGEVGLEAVTVRAEAVPTDNHIHD